MMPDGMVNRQVKKKAGIEERDERESLRPVLPAAIAQTHAAAAAAAEAATCDAAAAEAAATA